MTILTVDQLKKMCKNRVTAAQVTNMTSFVTSINKYGHSFDLDKIYNLSSMIGQVMVENGEFTHDREIWGPTAQQKKYEPGTDLAKKLGNTQKGDGSKFRGYGPIQLTGRANVTRFYKWALANYTSLGAPKPPNFVQDPKLITTDPWEGLSALWYWHVGNPEGTSLNKYAKDNNQLMVTKRINGGTTHYDRRLDYQARAALVLLGYGVTKDEIKRFQRDHATSAGAVDGVIGDRTRAALHLASKGKLPVTSKKTETITREVQVPVKVEEEKTWYKDPETITQLGGGAAVTSMVSFLTEADVSKIITIALIIGVVFSIWYLIKENKKKKAEQKAEWIENSSPIIVSRHVEEE